MANQSFEQVSITKYIDTTVTTLTNDLKYRAFKPTITSGKTNTHFTLANGGGGERAMGILMTPTKATMDSRTACEFAIGGGAKARIGADVTAVNTFLKVATGGVLIPVAGDQDYYIARSLSTGESGDLIDVIIDPGFYAVIV